MFNITLVGDIEIAAAFDAMPTALRDALVKEISSLSIGLRTYIVEAKLHGQVLNQRTGNLARSIKADEPIVEGDTVRGEVFSSGDVKYAAFWEFGFTGDETVRAHTRMYRSIDDGKHERTAAAVGTFTRHVDQPARSFMRTGLADQHDQIVEGLRGAAMRGMRARLGETA